MLEFELSTCTGMPRLTTPRFVLPSAVDDHADVACGAPRAAAGLGFVLPRSVTHRCWENLLFTCMNWTLCRRGLAGRSEQWTDLTRSNCEKQERTAVTILPCV